MGELRILHQLYVRNGAWGGMEKSFASFISATQHDPDLANYLVENLRDASLPVRQALSCLAAPAREVRRWHGLPLPKWPTAVRRWNRSAQARAWGVNRVLNWNQIGDVEPALLAHRLGAKAIYWERGAAWFEATIERDSAFSSCYDLYLANSEASRQMLRQVWNISGDIQICAPAVRTALRASPRILPSHRRLRLGFAARLRAFKGGVLAVHALHALVRRGADAELWIAGEGADRQCIEMEVKRLGLENRVRFLGLVAAMEPFFEQIDLLLHPALREPYGIICAEALSAGLPVVTAQVDGLPEVVDNALNGYCVTPVLPLKDYAGFGGNRADVYPRVYRPELGRVAEPGLADPEHLAAALAQIIEDAARYSSFSAAALAMHEQKFSWPVHLHRFKTLMAQAADSANTTAP